MEVGKNLSFPRIEGVVTTAHGSLPAAEVCAQIKRFGYAVSKKIRIYGEEFIVLSDPFPSDGGVAIHVRSNRTSHTRVLQLPATVIHRVKERFVRAA
jgi:hypothetical protein